MTISEINKKVSFVLIKMGLSPQTQGFSYLVDSIINKAIGDSDEISTKRTIKNRRYDSKNHINCMNKTLQSVSFRSIMNGVNKIANFPLITAETYLTASNFIAIMSELIRYEPYMSEIEYD